MNVLKTPCIKSLTILVIVLLSLPHVKSQTFSWNGTYNGTGANRTYSTTAGGVTMNATINNSQNAWYSGWPPQYSTSSPTGCSMNANNHGVLLYTDWGDRNQNITVTMDFSQAVGPVEFYLFDINDNNFGQWVDRVTVSATNASGGTVNVHCLSSCMRGGSAGNGTGTWGTVAGSGTPLLTLTSKAEESGCTCYGNNRIKVGDGVGCGEVKTITLTYTSVALQANPLAQYIILSNLVAVPVNPPTAIAISKTDAACGNNNGSVTLGAVTGGTAPYQYNFNNQGFSSTTGFTNLSAGTYPVVVRDANGCTYSTSVTIVGSSDIPTAIAITKTDIACGNNNGSATLGTVTGGTAPYQYNFNNQGFSSTTDFNNLSSGTYSVVVRDANGCTYSTSVTISESFSAPTAIGISATDASCGENNGSVTLGAVTGGTPPYQYNFNNQGFSATTDFNDLSTRTYSVVVRDANGCTYSTSITVSSTATPAIPTFTNPDPICQGAIFALPPNSNEGITGTWTPTINNTATTTYTFIPGGGQCATTTQITVVVNSEETPTFTNPGPICTGTNFTLPTTSDNGIPGTWVPTIDNTQTTTYTFTPNGGQCATSTTIEVIVNSEVTPTFTNSGPICTGTIFTLPTTSNNGITGTWIPAVDNTATTTYTFTPSGGCATPTTMEVVVDNQVTPTFTNPGPICSGTSFTLPTTSDNGIIGTWTPAINNTQTTTYTFTPDNAGCATQITMEVVVDNQVTPTFTNPGPICSGISFTLPITSDNGIIGTWTPAINNTQTTTYTFTPDNAGCAISTTLTVVIDNQITPTFTNPGPVCSGATFTLSPNSNEGITGTWTPAINNTATTTYTFTPGGGQCATTAQMTVVVNSEEVPTFTNPGPICPGTSFTLPTTSDNGISGTWSPVENNTETTIYTFTPNPSICAPSVTMTVIVDNQVVPTFINPGPICSGTNFTLPMTSGNGIPGTWTPAVNNTQTTIYTFTPNPGICASSTTMTVIINPNFDITLSDGVDICPGDTLSPIVITAIGGNVPYIFTYSVNNGNPVTISSNQNTAIIDVADYPGFNADNPNCYNITIGGSDAETCLAKDTIFADHFCIHQAPNASFSVNSENNGIYSTVNTSNGATSYEWYFGDNSPGEYTENVTHQFSTETSKNYTIELIAHSNHGCSDTAYQVIIVEEDLIFYVPNTFTPDGDEYNNVFKPVITSGFDPFNYELAIYDRWGERIFVSHDTEIGWDGTYNGNLSQDGTYTWKITLKVTHIDDRKEYVGHVNILR